MTISTLHRTTSAVALALTGITVAACGTAATRPADQASKPKSSVRACRAAPVSLVRGFERALTVPDGRITATAIVGPAPDVTLGTPELDGRVHVVAALLTTPMLTEPTVLVWVVADPHDDAPAHLARSANRAAYDYTTVGTELFTPPRDTYELVKRAEACVQR